ncbi:MAG: hypothetical protein ACHQ51_15685, partial [Elusimicrobiota bacterium]
MKIFGLIAAAALAFAGASRAASIAAPIPYDVKAAPLDDVSKDLLNGTGYEVRDDGHVWDKITETTVNREDMPYLLSRLASARRLRALLEINNIITRYDAERNLSPEDKEAVRTIVRQNWIVFGVAPRHDFRQYFSPQELESLDKIPARFDTMSPVTMNDPAPESVTADAPPPAVVPAPVVAPVPAPVPTTAAVPAPAAVPIAVPVSAAVPTPAVVPAAVPVAVPVAVPATAAVPTPAVVPAAVPTAVPVAVPVPIAPPPPVAVAPAVAPVAVAKIIPTLTPMMDLPSLKRESPFAPATPPVVPPAVPVPAAPPAA